MIRHEPWSSHIRHRLLRTFGSTVQQTLGNFPPRFIWLIRRDHDDYREAGHLPGQLGFGIGRFIQAHEARQEKNLPGSRVDDSGGLVG